jgi:hypothetical protein
MQGGLNLVGGAYSGEFPSASDEMTKTRQAVEDFYKKVLLHILIMPSSSHMNTPRIRVSKRFEFRNARLGVMRELNMFVRVSRLLVFEHLLLSVIQVNLH